jgi:hypothetical protein
MNYFLGISAFGDCGVLTSEKTFKQLQKNKNTITSKDFVSYEATDLMGRDTVIRTIAIKRFEMTGKIIKLKTPITFYGKDITDTGTHHWDITIDTIAEVRVIRSIYKR